MFISILYVCHLLKNIKENFNKKINKAQYDVAVLRVLIKK